MAPDNGMRSQTFVNFDPRRVPSPCFVVDEVALNNNLQLLAGLQRESRARILLALKAFSMFHFAPQVSAALSGISASGLWETRLGREEFGGEVHCCSPAYSADEFDAVTGLADHIVFNSLAQWQRFKKQFTEAQSARPELKAGLRINPGHSEVTTPLYDPSAPGSRLGLPIAELDGANLEGLSGLHFHTLCEQGYGPLDRTLAIVEASCGDILQDMAWLNLGGGHHLTANDYDRAALARRLQNLRETYALQVYLEPGEAIAIGTGVLVSEVLDVTHNERDIAILDTSATCHMPDTLEMPYQADVFGASPNDSRPHAYRLGGQSCLAGDVMGDYSFDQPLSIGDRLMFDDMAHYTMVKTTTFNGVRLPALAVWNSSTDELKIVREFGYEDFRRRLS